MPFTRFRVRTSGGSMVNIAPNVNNRLNVRDVGGTNREITNSPDAAPPTGEVPVVSLSGTVTIPWWYVTQVEPVPLAAVPVVTITSPAAPISVDTGDVVTLEASCTLDGNPASAATVVWTSSLTGDLFTGAGATLTNLAVGVHTITATFSNPPYTATDTETVTVTNVATPPTVTILSPTTGDSYPYKSAIKFNATAVDTVDGELSERIKWYSNTTTGVLYEGQTFVLSGLSPGTHTIRATCRDTDSPPNEGEDSVTLYIISDAPDVAELPLKGQIVIGRQAYGSGVVQ